MKFGMRSLASAAIALLALTFAIAVPADAMKISQTAGGSMVAALGTLENSGGTLIIYTGTQPTNPDTAISGNTALATFTFSTTAFGSATLVSSKMQITGSLTSSTVTAGNSGTATWARMLKSDGTTVVADFTAGTSGTDIILNSASITSGGNVTISAIHLNEPVD